MWQLFREALVSLLTAVTYDLIGFRKKIMDANLLIAFPEMPKKERQRCARQSIAQQWRNVVDLPRLPLLSQDWFDKHADIHRLKETDSLVQKEGRGLLVLSLHLGNPDLTTSCLGHHRFAVSLISKFFRSSWLNRFWYHFRGQGGTEYIEPHGPQTAFKILAALKRKRSVIFVIDQFMGAPYGITASFFGKKCGTPMGLALFQMKTGLPVVPCWNVQPAFGKLQVFFGEPIELEKQKSKEETIQHMTQIYNRQLEQLIAAHPESWLWMHRRWKREL